MGKSVDWLDVYSTSTDGATMVYRGLFVYAQAATVLFGVGVLDVEKLPSAAASSGARAAAGTRLGEPGYPGPSPPSPAPPSKEAFGAGSAGLDNEGAARGAGDADAGVQPDEVLVNWGGGHGGMLDFDEAIDRNVLVRRELANPHAIAQRIIVRKFMPPGGPEARANSTFTAMRYAGSWWQRPTAPTSLPRWKCVDEERIKATITRELSQLWRHAPTKDDHDRVLPLLTGSSKSHTENTLGSMVEHCFVPQDVTMPAWLPPAFDEEGMPRWTSVGNVEDVSQEECSPYTTLDGKPLLATDVIAIKDGLLDLTAWCNEELPIEERLRILPHTPRLFNAVMLPHSIDREGLIAASKDGEDLEEYFKARAPNVMKFITDCSAGDPAWANVAQEMLADVMTYDRSLQVILWMQGAPGAGKTTFVECLMWSVVGEDNICPCSAQMLTGRFAMPAMLGVLVYAIDELRVDGHTPTAVLLDRMLSISGGARQVVEDKNRSLTQAPKVRMPGRFVVNLNRDPDWRGAEATVRRLRILPFQPLTGAVDTGLWAKLRAEAQHTFAWALFGLPRLRKQKDFTKLQAGQEMLEQIRRKISIVQAFVDDCCVLGHGHGVETSMLRSLFYKFCRDEGDDRAEDYFTEVRFGQQVSDIKGVRRELKMRRPGTMRADNSRVPSSHRGSEPYRIYEGIRPLMAGESREDAAARPMVVVDWGDGLPKPGEPGQGLGGQQATMYPS